MASPPAEKTHSTASDRVREPDPKDVATDNIHTPSEPTFAGPCTAPTFSASLPDRPGDHPARASNGGRRIATILDVVCPCTLNGHRCQMRVGCGRPMVCNGRTKLLRLFWEKILTVHQQTLDCPDRATCGYVHDVKVTCTQ